MRKAVLKLSNGEQLKISEGQYLIPIVKYQTEDKEWSVSKSKLFEAWETSVTRSIGPQQWLASKTFSILASQPLFKLSFRDQYLALTLRPPCPNPVVGDLFLVAHPVDSAFGDPQSLSCFPDGQGHFIGHRHTSF